MIFYIMVNKWTNEGICWLYRSMWNGNIRKKLPFYAKKRIAVCFELLWKTVVTKQNNNFCIELNYSWCKAAHDPFLLMLLKIKSVILSVLFIYDSNHLFYEMQHGWRENSCSRVSFLIEWWLEVGLSPNPLCYLFSQIFIVFVMYIMTKSPTVVQNGFLHLGSESNLLLLIGNNY